MKHPIRNSFLGLHAGFWLGAAVVTSSSLLMARWVKAGDSSKAPAVHLNVSESEVARDGHNINSFAPIVKQVFPSVVKVSVTTKGHKVTMPRSPFGDNNNPFQQFFGFGGNGGTYETPPQSGLGSGVIVTRDGYILTNNHVVEGADVIKVALNDGREFTGKVVGRDPKTDVAVIKIDAKELPFLTLADSDKAEVGDRVLAIGNPFGVGETVTQGIISGKSRGNVETPGNYEDFIQTDAAINPGNSGGALVDIEGRLIGINTAILSRTGGSQGIGFAVPVNMAREVMESLVAKGRVVRGYLGVILEPLNADLAAEFKIQAGKGALVADVSPDGPADKAGFKSGDVILEFNSKTVTDSDRLRWQVADTTPGASVPVKVLRDGHEKTLDVKLAEIPSDKMAKNDVKGDDASDSLNGVTVSDIDANARQQLSIPHAVSGALITQVDPNSASYEQGVRRFDVITEINHKTVQSAEDAVKLTEKVATRKTLVKIWRPGNNGEPSGSHYLVINEDKAG